MTTIQMTPAQWAAVEDNPIQRDTEEHAKKALRNHLKKPSSAHRHVHAARLPNGKLVKLDGHTRSLLWQQGRLMAPEVVEVALHEAADLKEVIELYKHFDNEGSTENATDRLSGAYRLHAVKPSGRLLVSGGISSALNIIDQSQRPIYELVEEWKGELELLDALNATKRAMPSVLIAAALVTFRKHGLRALQFWTLYCTGAGSRIDGKSCGVDELTRIVADLRARKILATGGNAARREQAGRAISCCEAWLNGRSFSKGAKASDFGSYVDSLKARRLTAHA